MRAPCALTFFSTLLPVSAVGCPSFCGPLAWPSGLWPSGQPIFEPCKSRSGFRMASGEILFANKGEGKKEQRSEVCQESCKKGQEKVGRVTTADRAEMGGSRKAHGGRRCHILTPVTKRPELELTDWLMWLCSAAPGWSLTSNHVPFPSLLNRAFPFPVD